MPAVIPNRSAISSFHVVEDEDLSSTVRQRLHRCLDVHLHVGPGRAHADHRGGLLTRRTTLAPLRERGTVRQDHVDRDPIEPAAERRVAPKRVQAAPRPDERLLCGLVRLVRAQHAPGEGVDTRHVPPVESLERCRIAAGGEACVYGIDGRVGL